MDAEEGRWKETSAAIASLRFCFWGLRIGSLPCSGVSGLIMSGLLLLTTSPKEAAAAEIARAASRRLQVGVDKTSGQLVEFIDSSSHRNLAGTATNPGGLWELEFADGQRVAPANAGACRVAALSSKPSGLRLEWREFGIPQASKLNVEVTVRLDARQPLSRWQISLHNLEGQTPARIRFPRLLEVPAQVSVDGVL